MATDYRKAAQSLLDGDLVDHGDLDTIASAAVHALLAIHDLLDDRLPEPSTRDDWLDEPVPVPHPADTPERPAEDDPDEALAKALATADERTVTWLGMAREVREHIGHEVQMGNARLLADMRVRAEKAKADLADMTRQRDEWQARHAALRAGVERVRRNRTTLTDVLMCVADVLDLDDAYEREGGSDA